MDEPFEEEFSFEYISQPRNHTFSNLKSNTNSIDKFQHAVYDESFWKAKKRHDLNKRKSSGNQIFTNKTLS